MPRFDSLAYVRLVSRGAWCGIGSGHARLTFGMCLAIPVTGCQIPQGVHSGVPNSLRVFCLGVPIPLGYLARGCQIPHDTGSYPLSVSIHHCPQQLQLAATQVERCQSSF